MRGWIDDLAYATRRLVRSPGFSLTALTILVLGIGVNSAAFSVVNAMLLRPPPFEAPERVVTVLQDGDDGRPSSTSYPAYLDMARTPGVFESVSAHNADRAVLELEDGLAPVLVEYATSSYMDVIGLSPSRGTWFEELADDPSGPPVAVLSHKMWRDRLGSDPDVLGRILHIGGGSVTVVGVGPEVFNGGSGFAAIDLWLSMSAMAPTGGRVMSLERRQDHPFTVRARLAPGVSVVQASAAMDQLAEELARTYPGFNADRGITVFSSLDTRISPEVDAQLFLAGEFTMGVVVMVLLIGTLNLANLLLVRNTARAREIAVRLALGAGRGRLVRVVLGEAVLLSGLGGVGGFAVAYGAAQALSKSRLDFGLPLSVDVRIDVAVLAFTLVASAASGLVFGLLPGLRATRRDVTATLRDETAGLPGARRRFGLTGLLVAGQVAASLVLLAVAGVFLESLARARAADPGFAYENTAYVQVGLWPLALSDEEATLLYQRIEERLEGLPGIGRVTTAAALPAEQFGTTTLLLGSAIDGVDKPTEIPWNFVSQDYFEVMDVPLLHGRVFDQGDLTGPFAAVVSAAFARTHWGRTDIVGETYRSESTPNVARPIIGVVDDATVRALGERPRASIYWVLNAALPRATFIFEAESSAAEAIRLARAAIGEIDGRLLLLRASSMREHLGATLDFQRVVGTLLAVLGALALLLAVLGVYGVVSFAASRRRQEVGIRMALGAATHSVVRLFVRDVSAIVFVGAVGGLAISIPAARLVGELFTGRGATVVSTGAVALLLLLTAMVAAVIPALRAARSSPTDALRLD